MIDTHYDLLTIFYCCYKDNNLSYIKKIKEETKDIKGFIANLYFMSREEMKEELHLEDINVYEMFKISTELFKKYFPDKKVIYSIEGCDYIKDENELEKLYDLGLRNILLVWNCENKYASGNRCEKGLTPLGKKFIEKAVSLGISIDMSHMNKNTFWDTIKLLKELKNKGKNIKVLASHSNCYNLCKNIRNLDDNQILAIKELDGIVGLVSYGPFINEEEKDLENNYLLHIKHIETLIGINNIAIATDNMDFATDLYGIDEGISVYRHKDIKDKLTKLLSNYYNEEEIEKILFKNIENYLM